MGHSIKIIAACMLAFFLCSQAKAQNPQYAFKVFFKDKNATTFSLNNPVAYLSQRALDRRTKYGIAIDSTDLPVVSSYVDSVLHVTNGVLHLKSRWQNSCVILLEDSSQIQNIQNLSFVASSKQVAYYSNGLHEKPAAPDTTSSGEKPTGFDQNFYGGAWSQIHLCNGEYVHQQGYMGEGMLIAVIDVGFTGVNTAAAFDSMFQQNRLLETWNYIYDTSFVYSYAVHGCQVLSCMASYVPQTHVGTAPKAMYALYLTDDANTEQVIEEDNFAAATERADSIGADVITTSLGYNTFDNPADSHTYSDLDGHSTVSAKAANKATAKGIMVLASAGNEGITSWQHILTPGDADSAMTIGSVDNTKAYAISSGRGPNASGNLKPDVCGQGVGASVIASGGFVTTQSGTSYSTPIIAGLTACLMQYRPNLKPLEVRALISSMADSFANPNYDIGNGVPDFKKAFLQVTAINTVSGNDASLAIYPNPANATFYIQSGKKVNYYIYDIQGKLLQSGTAKDNEGISIKEIPTGLYLLKVQSSGLNAMRKLVVTR